MVNTVLAGPIISTALTISDTDFMWLALFHFIRIMAEVHPLDMVAVCPKCLENSKSNLEQIRQLRSTAHGCFDPDNHAHDLSQWSLSVLDEKSGSAQFMLHIMHNNIACGRIK